MKIWSTKYALTNGIALYGAEIDGTMAIVRGKTRGTLDLYLHGEGKEWHRTLDAAIVRAEEMRVKKIVSLEKQIKKFKALKFTVEEAKP